MPCAVYAWSGSWVMQSMGVCRFYVGIGRGRRYLMGRRIAAVDPVLCDLCIETPWMVIRNRPFRVTRIPRNDHFISCHSVIHFVFISRNSFLTKFCWKPYIHHHGPAPITNICHLPNTHCFSLITTFKGPDSQNKTPWKWYHGKCLVRTFIYLVNFLIGLKNFLNRILISLDGPLNRSCSSCELEFLNSLWGLGTE